MFEKKYHLYLNDEEKADIVKALIDKRNALIRAGNYTDGVDDLLIKIVKRRPKWRFLSQYSDRKKYF